MVRVTERRFVIHSLPFIKVIQKRCEHFGEFTRKKPSPSHIKCLQHLITVHIQLRWITWCGRTKNYGFLNQNYAKTIQYGIGMENTKEDGDLDMVDKLNIGLWFKGHLATYIGTLLGDKFGRKLPRS